MTLALLAALLLGTPACAGLAQAPEEPAPRLERLPSLAGVFVFDDDGGAGLFAVRVSSHSERWNLLPSRPIDLPASRPAVKVAPERPAAPPPPPEAEGSKPAVPRLRAVILTSPRAAPAAAPARRSQRFAQLDF